MDPANKAKGSSKENVPVFLRGGPGKAKAKAKKVREPGEGLPISGKAADIWTLAKSDWKNLGKNSTEGNITDVWKNVFLGKPKAGGSKNPPPVKAATEDKKANHEEKSSGRFKNSEELEKFLKKRGYRTNSWIIWFSEQKNYHYVSILKISSKGSEKIYDFEHKELHKPADIDEFLSRQKGPGNKNPRKHQVIIPKILQDTRNHGSLTEVKAATLLEGKEPGTWLLYAKDGAPTVARLKEPNEVEHLPVDKNFTFRDLIREIEGDTSKRILPKSYKTGLREKLKRTAERKIELEGEPTRGGLLPLGEYYHPEFLDVQHAYGSDIEPAWKVWKSDQRIRDNFRDWMEKLRKGKMPFGASLLPKEFNVSKLNLVKYFNDAEKEAHEIEFCEGRVFFKGEEKPLGDTGDFRSNNVYVFVQSPEGKFYAALYKKGKTHHSSLLGGKPVRSAGEIFITKGRITAISKKSGHYKPDEVAFSRGLSDLKNLGADLEKVKVLKENKWGIRENDTKTPDDLISEYEENSQHKQQYFQKYIIDDFEPKEVRSRLEEHTKKFSEPPKKFLVWRNKKTEELVLSYFEHGDKVIHLPVEDIPVKESTLYTEPTLIFDKKNSEICSIKSFRSEKWESFNEIKPA